MGIKDPRRKAPSTAFPTRMWRRFAICQRAQALVEYALLLAFVGVGIAAMFLAISTPVSAIWNTTDKHLKKGHAYAKGHDK